jgi:hypothetical protein
MLGVLPFSQALARADLEGMSVDVEDPPFAEALARIGDALEGAAAAQSAT